MKYNPGPVKFTNPKDILIRHICILLMSAFFASLDNSGKIFLTGQQYWLASFGFHFFYIATIWNGNVLIFDWLNVKLRWDEHLVIKITASSLIAIVWPIIVHYSFNAFLYPVFFHQQCNLTSKENYAFVVLAVSVTLFINAVFTAIAFFNFWRNSITEREELKRTNLNAEFQTLKNQINPHFLFNSLNTLTSLIEENPAAATAFVHKMSAVYRYVLTQRDKERVTLAEELPFIESYIYLNKIRFGDNLQVRVDISEKDYQKEVATLALQILIENAIKHNIISVAKPLHIEVIATDNELVVRNNLQRKQVPPQSNGIGLQNIMHRYTFLTDREVQVQDDGKQFIVKLPLL